MSSVIDLLNDLISIPSVNPSLVPGAPGEAAIAAYIADWLRARGFDVQVSEVLPGRPNVVGVLDGRAPGPSVMFCGHVDTVGVGEMEAPYAPQIRDGRLYGRGAQDMKAGLAAMLHAASGIAARGGLARGRILVACVIDEEYASAGADAVTAEWRADAAIITEPTGLTIGIAHKGFSAAEITVHGRAAHGSRPDEGIDSIVRMGRVLARLEARDRELQSSSPVPLLGTGSLHASRIDGGGELSSYPARCCLQYERRTLPGEADTVALDDLVRIADELSAADQHFRADVRLLLARPPYAIDPAHPVSLMLAKACHVHGLHTAFEGLSYWTDAAILSGAGIPTALFGPRGAGMHSAEEYVLVDDVLTCRAVLEDAARQLLEHTW